ncbi:unnamed protein product [Ambrosiozyma monospora]|uniref:Cytochrome c oxidase assembly protein COX20, mitochondrial n=1 Tax=Ambrosiozyma monospora TaxID=43982 RepID=A0A9W7DHA7_AMBMO|nr:unnamed protein product [Ambrosiozyma monospora]
MVWNPFSRKKSEDATSSQEKPSAPVLLEDIQQQQQPPTIPPSPTTAPEQSQLSAQTQEISRFLRNLSLDDFQFAKLVQIPCFRDAGLIGFSTFFVFSSVMFLYHKNFRKSINWGFGGLMLGSIFGWEQCNHFRKQSNMAVQMAQERFQERQHQKILEEQQNQGKK